MLWKRSAGVLLLLAMPVVALAQSAGNLAGTVVDAATGESLSGVTVGILGTRLGAVTDLKGSYFIDGISPGSYSVRASFIGYQSQTVQDVDVRAGDTRELNFTLAPDTSQVDLPDLLVSSLTHVPANPTTNDEITFTAVVENRGAATAGASILTFSVAGETRPPAFKVPSLAPGERFAVEQTARLADAGTYRSRAVADADDAVEESDEANNDATHDYTVVRAQRTLTVASQDPDRGVPITVAPADLGNGTGGPTPFTRLYDDGTQVTLTAPAEADENGFVEWRLNGSPLSSDRSVTVTMDRDHAATAVYSQLDLPDLLVSSLTHFPANPTTDDEITFTAVVVNRGAAAAGASTLTFSAAGEAPGQTFQVPSLAPTDSFAVEHTTRLADAGTYQSRAVADADDAVEESNEANNAATHTYSVREGPSLQVARPSRDDVWRMGTTETIRWTSRDVSGNLRIELLRSGDLERLIASSTSNDGAFDWPVPLDLPPAIVYTIRITSVDDSDVMGESAPFAIEGPYAIAVADVTPHDVQHLDWGASAAYVVLVENEQGTPIRDAVVTVRDGLQERVISAGSTDRDGLRTYTTTAPQGKPDGLYDLVFTAAKEGFPPGDPVVRQVRIEHAAPELSASSDGLDFGEVFVGSQTDRSFTITNTGTAELVVTPELSGSTLDEFTLLGGDGTVSLSPSSPPHQITLRYAPRDEGPDEAALVLRSNADDKSIRLRGSGISPDIEPPAGVGEPVLGQSFDVRLAVSENFAPTRRSLFYRRGGEASYQEMELTESATGFAGSIPSDFVTERGIDFYVRLSDGETSVSYPKESPERNPVHARVLVREPIVRTTSPGLYNMLSVPIELDDPTPASLFNDDFGPDDRTRWRLLRWEPASGRYEEHPGIKAAFQPGTAFWLINRFGQSFEVEDAMSVDAAQPFQLVLEPGWNQIGNPFAFPVAWNSVTGREEVDGPWSYNPTQNDFEACCAAILEPWQGYFVLNDAEEPVTLRIPPVESGAAVPNAGASRHAADYALQLMAELDGHISKDVHNYVGLSKHASEGVDAMDHREAPRIGDHVRLSIVESGRHMASSFKPIDGMGRQWDVEVDTGADDALLSASRRVRITVQEHGLRPDDFGLYVFDVDRARMVDLTRQSFEVTLDAHLPRRHLRVILGPEAFVEGITDRLPLPAGEFALEQNYPNPFNAETMIRFQLPARQHAALEIYDALGRRVRTLVDSIQEPGRHEYRWDGLDDAQRRVASGVYVGRLRSGPSIGAIQMLLMH